jgi:hypothetical protein
MHDPRDPVDAWLDTRVEPLAPLPGTFERITRQARRRKTGRVLTSAAGAAILVVAAVVAPGIASSLRGHPTGPSQPAPQGTGAFFHHHGEKGGSNSHSSSPEKPLPSALSLAGSNSPVPGNFQPTSVTFVGPDVGAVIGQAGTAGHCATRYCTSLAGTSNYGASWYGVNAPVTGPPDGSSGVGQIRFLDIHDGWAFGPALWVTHDGGAHWYQENTFGQRVLDVEAAGDRAFALLAACTGTGPQYASDCTNVSLYSSLASSDQWTAVPGLTSGLNALPAQSQPFSASLVLTADRGYLLDPAGQLLSGPLTGTAWTVASSSLPCQPGPPGSAGQPASALPSDQLPAALLAADSAGLVLVCASVTEAPAASSSQSKSVFVSSDGGTQWSAAGTPPAAGTALALAAQPGGLMLLATDAGIYRSGDGGSTWQLAQARPAGAVAGQPGFSYVGMTSARSGVALPADSGLHEVFTTSDGGLTWQSNQVSAP